MTGPVWISLALAVLIVLALSRPARTLVGGVFERDRKGRLILILTPVSKKRRRKK